MENCDRRRKIEDFDPLTGDLRTAYQKTDFLAVWDDSAHNFWLLGFFGQRSSRY
jgi:hypothetical protein